MTNNGLLEDLLSDFSIDKEFPHLSLIWKRFCKFSKRVSTDNPNAIEDEIHLVIFYNHYIERKEIIQLNYEKNQMCLALNSEMKRLLIVKIRKTAIYRQAKFVEFFK